MAPISVLMESQGGKIVGLLPAELQPLGEIGWQPSATQIRPTRSSIAYWKRRIASKARRGSIACIAAAALSDTHVRAREESYARSGPNTRHYRTGWQAFPLKPPR